MVLQNLGFSLERDTTEESQLSGTFPTKMVSVLQSLSLHFTAWPTLPTSVTPKQLPSELPNTESPTSTMILASASDREGKLLTPNAPPHCTLMEKSSFHGVPKGIFVLEVSLLLLNLINSRSSAKVLLRFLLLQTCRIRTGNTVVSSKGG